MNSHSVLARGFSEPIALTCIRFASTYLRAGGSQVVPPLVQGFNCSSSGGSEKRFFHIILAPPLLSYLTFVKFPCEMWFLPLKIYKFWLKFVFLNSPLSFPIFLILALNWTGIISLILSKKSLFPFPRTNTEHYFIVLATGTRVLNPLRFLDPLYLVTSQARRQNLFPVPEA